MKYAFFLLALSAASLQGEVTAAGKMFTKALKDNDLKAIETLLSSGFDVNLPVEGHTPLGLALQFNRPGAVEILLAAHADPNEPILGGKVASNMSPLQVAAQLSSLHIASMLIEAGARVDAKALQYALREDRHLDTIRLLIEKGADLNARDEEGASPLDNAVWRGALDTIAILLAHGARLNESDTKTGATPINEAAYRGNASIVGYLLQFHPDLRISDKRGYIPLDNAIRMGKEDCALLLLEAEPKELLTPQFLGKTMEAAIQKNESDLVRALLGKGADPNLGGPNGASPLEDASLQGHAAIAAMLLDGGALVNRLDPVSGTTALYAAASFGKGEVVKLLLNRGANPTLCGKNRTSPYQAAVENGFSEVATIIREHGGSRSCEH